MIYCFLSRGTRGAIWVQASHNSSWNPFVNKLQLVVLFPQVEKRNRLSPQSFYSLPVVKMSNSWQGRKKLAVVFIVLNKCIRRNWYIHLREDWKVDVIRGAVTAVDD